MARGRGSSRPAVLGMEPESLDLIVGSDLVYGGPKNGDLLLSAINTLISQKNDDRPLGVWMPLPRHGRARRLLARGSVQVRSHAARARRSDDAVAEESGVDGVDIVELRQGIG